VLGRRFADVVALDRQWAESLTDVIFPLDDQKRTPLAATWCAYLRRSIEPEVFELLHARYEWAVVQLDANVAGASDCERHLAEHLMALYGHGFVPLESELITGFFARGAPTVRAYAIEYVGVLLSDTGGDLEPEVADRLKTLWQWRREIIDEKEPSASDEDETAAFAWWFESGKLDSEWALENLEWALQRAGARIDGYGIAQQLRVLADRLPGELHRILRCFELMIVNDGDHGHLFGWQAELRSVVELAIGSSDPAGNGLAHSIANRMVARGYLAYRELSEAGV
jgi:hypothetical protein